MRKSMMIHVRVKANENLDDAARVAGAFVSAMAARSADAFTLTLLGAQDLPLVGRLSDLLGDDGRVRLEFSLPAIANKSNVSEVRDLASRPRSRSLLRDAPAI